jgi:hypothetical protein
MRGRTTDVAQEFPRPIQKILQSLVQEAVERTLKHRYLVEEQQLDDEAGNEHDIVELRHETSEAVNSAAVNEIGRTPSSRGFVEDVRKSPQFGEGGDRFGDFGFPATRLTSEKHDELLNLI